MSDWKRVTQSRVHHRCVIFALFSVATAKLFDAFLVSEISTRCDIEQKPPERDRPIFQRASTVRLNYAPLRRSHRVPDRCIPVPRRSARLAVTTTAAARLERLDPSARIVVGIRIVAACREGRTATIGSAPVAFAATISAFPLSGNIHRCSSCRRRADSSIPEPVARLRRTARLDTTGTGGADLRTISRVVVNRVARYACSSGRGEPYGRAERAGPASRMSRITPPTRPRSTPAKAMREPTMVCDQE